uniref:Phosphotransferase n=1 Tax=Dermatophagoides pteronyssinus TaxID=6956 RepID=A0A6P6YD68_DERPT|nr:hexokinase-like [Dermatophagoides pteronyssinus]
MSSDHKESSYKQKNIELADLLTKQLIVSNEDFEKVSALLSKEFDRGLRSTEDSFVKMYLTYVRSLPNGEENGRFLALDLGGTNVRALLVEFHRSQSESSATESNQKQQQQEPQKGSIEIIDSSIETIPTEIFHGTGEQLFDFIAEFIIEFAFRNKLTGERIALGFSFSFPSIQKGIAEATLVTWTKTFNCSGVVGCDVVRLFKASLERKAHPSIPFIDVVAILNDTTGTLIYGALLDENCRIGLIVGTASNACVVGNDVVRLLKASLKRKTHHSIPFIDVVAIINDTTGTLIYGALQDKNCGIGLIVGTGSNACYVEYLSKIEKWPFNYSDPKQVVINCECGAFGDNHVIDWALTNWDRRLNYESLNLNKQIHEKLISGMYLPEILRRCLLTLIELGIVFEGKTPIELFRPYSIKTKYMSFIDQDNENDENNFPNTRKALADMFNSKNPLFKNGFSDSDVKIIHMINRRITKRSANFVANALWTLAIRIDNVDVSIAYDGSLICLHPYYRSWVEEKLNEFIKKTGIKKRFRLIHANDGSLYGAAIVAAICYREKRPKFIKKRGKIYEITRF